jgi:hypothetical protein
VVNTSQSLFPKQNLENALETWLSGMNLAKEATTSKRVRLITVGYKHNSSKVLCFIATKNVGSIIPGDPRRV